MVIGWQTAERIALVTDTRAGRRPRPPPLASTPRPSSPATAPPTTSPSASAARGVLGQRHRRILLRHLEQDASPGAGSPSEPGSPSPTNRRSSTTATGYTARWATAPRPSRKTFTPPRNARHDHHTTAVRRIGGRSGRRPLPVVVSRLPVGSSATSRWAVFIGRGRWLPA